MAVQMMERPTAEAPVQLSGKMTYEEFLDWLDEDTHADWVNGVAMMHRPVSLQHQQIHKFLLQLLDTFVQTRDLGTVAHDPFQMKTGSELPGRAPDILFVADENLGRLKPNVLDGPADLVVEVVSPSSRALDRGAKYYEYEQGGVREYWLVDPERRQAEFYVLGSRGVYDTVLVAEDGVYRSRVLDGLWMKVDWLWQDPLPPVLGVLKEWGLL